MKNFERKNLGKRGAGLFRLTFVMGVEVGEGGAIFHPNIHNVLSP